MKRKPRLVIERRGWMWVGHDNGTATTESLTRAFSANGKGYPSEMQTGELLRVQAEGEGRPEKFLE